MNKENLVIQDLEFDDLQKYRELRLEALKRHPEAFGADYKTIQKLPTAYWETHLKTDRGTMFTAQISENLVGMSGIVRPDSPKMSHHANIWGVYVSADYRRGKVGEKLISACLEWAKHRELFSVKLSVVTTNVQAINLYLKFGFQIYGVDPKVIKVNDIFYDELLMVKSL